MLLLLPFLFFWLLAWHFWLPCCHPTVPCHSRALWALPIDPTNPQCSMSGALGREADGRAVFCHPGRQVEGQQELQQQVGNWGSQGWAAGRRCRINHDPWAEQLTWNQYCWQKVAAAGSNFGSWASEEQCWVGNWELLPLWIITCHSPLRCRGCTEVPKLCDKWVFVPVFSWSWTTSSHVPPSLTYSPSGLSSELNAWSVADIPFCYLPAVPSTGSTTPLLPL